MTRTEKETNNEGIERQKRKPRDNRNMTRRMDRKT